MLKKIDTSFISEADKDLLKLRQAAKNNPAVSAEIAKHQRLHQLRDNANANQAKNKLWQDF